MAKSPNTLPSRALVRRYIQEAVALGLPVSGFEVRPTGEIVIHTAAATTAGPDDALAAWERANAKRKA